MYGNVLVEKWDQWTSSKKSWRTSTTDVYSSRGRYGRFGAFGLVEVDFCIFWYEWTFSVERRFYPPRLELQQYERPLLPTNAFTSSLLTEVNADMSTSWDMENGNRWSEDEGE